MLIHKIYLFVSNPSECIFSEDFFIPTTPVKPRKVKTNEKKVTKIYFHI